MKYFYILLLISVVSVGQTTKERLRIISSYRQVDIIKLNDTIALMDKQQKDKIVLII